MASTRTMEPRHSRVADMVFDLVMEYCSSRCPSLWESAQPLERVLEAQVEKETPIAFARAEAKWNRKTRDNLESRLEVDRRAKAGRNNKTFCRPCFIVSGHFRSARVDDLEHWLKSRAQGHDRSEERRVGKEC